MQLDQLDHQKDQKSEEPFQMVQIMCQKNFAWVSFAIYIAIDHNLDDEYDIFFNNDVTNQSIALMPLVGGNISEINNPKKNSSQNIFVLNYKRSLFLSLYCLFESSH